MVLGRSEVSKVVKIHVKTWFLAILPDLRNRRRVEIEVKRQNAMFHGGHIRETAVFWHILHGPDRS